MLKHTGRTVLGIAFGSVTERHQILFDFNETVYNQPTGDAIECARQSDRCSRQKITHQRVSSDPGAESSRSFNHSHSDIRMASNLLRRGRVLQRFLGRVISIIARLIGSLLPAPKWYSATLRVSGLLLPVFRPIVAFSRFRN